MEMTDDLREKLKAARTSDDAKRAIEEAGMLLSDDELEGVSGGVKVGTATHKCPICKKTHKFLTAYPWCIRGKSGFVTTQATQYCSYSCIFSKYTKHGRDYYYDDYDNPLEM